MTSKPARGVRNNNPLNIRVGQDWKGEMPDSRKTADQKAEKEFEVFETPADGFRAGAIVLRNYQAKHGLKTVFAMIHRFAPPNENNTVAYCRFVAEAMGIAPHDEFDFSDYDMAFPMLRAMAIRETGHAFSDADINRGLETAGIPIGNRPLGKTRTAQGVKLAAVGLAASTVTDVVQQFDLVGAMGQAIQVLAPAMPFLEPVIQGSKYAGLVILVLGLAYVWYARRQDRAEGIR